MKQQEIFDQAINQFKEFTGASVNIFNKKLITNNKSKADQLIELEISIQNARFLVSIKNEITQNNIKTNA